MRPATSRTPAESSDAVGLVIALLVHFPEIATIAAHPAAGTIVLSFVVNRRLDRGARNALREAVSPILARADRFLAAISPERFDFEQAKADVMKRTSL